MHLKVEGLGLQRVWFGGGGVGFGDGVGRLCGVCVWGGL